MSWRTMRAAAAAMRRDLRARGGVIVIHRTDCALTDCALHWSPECDCRPRR